MADIKQKYWIGGQWVDVEAENANNLDWRASTDFADKITEKRLDHSVTHMIFGNNDWSSLIYDIEAGSKNKIKYNALSKCITAVGANIKCGIRMPMPIEPLSTYMIKVRVKKAAGSGTFSFGIDTLTNEYKSVGQVHYSMGVANGVTLNSTTSVYTGLFSGYNLVSEKNHNKFTAGGCYFNLVFYAGLGGTADSITNIESIEVLKAPDELFVGPNRVWHEGNFNPDLKADASYVDRELLYSNDTPIVVGIGDISAGDTFANVNVMEMLTKMLYPYVAPAIGLSASVGAATREFGNPINTVNLTANVTKKSRPITGVKFYKDNTLVHTMPVPKPGGGSEVYNCTTPITTTATFTAKVEDGRSTITSGSIKYTFVYPMYVGNTPIMTPSAEAIRSMEKKIVSKSNIDKVYTIKDERFCIAYPASYGHLKSILDANSFEILSDFQKTTINMVMLDKTTQSYNLYVSNNLVELSGFKVSYKF